MRGNRDIGRVLRAAVYAEPEQLPRVLLEGAHLDDLSDSAVVHGVSGYVWRLVGGSEAVPEAVRAELSAARLGAVRAHLEGLRALAWLRDVVPASEVTWLVVKGPVLAELVHGQPDLRAYGDLDVIVPAQQVGLVFDRLVDAGAVPLLTDWGRLSAERAAELPLRLPTGWALDLHWHLVNGWRLRDALSVPMPSLLSRAVAQEVGGIPMTTLDTTDTLLHLLVHAAISGGDRLMLLKDIERLLATRDVSWGEVVVRAAEWRVALIAAVVLARVARVTGAAVPPEVLTELARGGESWVRMARVLSWGSAPENRRPGPSVSRMVYRATRSSSSDSARELWRRVRTAARQRARAPVVVTPRRAMTRKQFFARIAEDR